MIAEPEIAEMELTPDDRFLVMGSDGLWDVFSREKVVEIMSRIIEEGREDDASQM